MKQQIARLLTRQNLMILGFFPIVIFALGMDSRYVLERGVAGQIYSNLAAPFYMLLVLFALRPEQRLMAVVFVPFSALGEYIFSLVFQLYRYTAGEVPFYVPFGHAILFSTGLLIADTPLVRRHEQAVKRGLLAFHGGLFAVALLAWGDTLSALFGLVFLALMRRKGARPLYLIMGVLVLYIEVVGTQLGCWAWAANPWGALHTTNPPVGAFVCYVIADVLVIKIARRLAGAWARLRPAVARAGGEV
ncbi:hypothetical protein F8S13_02400 [Chloroflexia bacterium SDU3-3]|nr:hypothetical protein F8S13_02400 [Chloroflexia bacterium SDU3-3]